MFHSVLIANRGEIACRIMATAHARGLKTIAVYSDADADAQHVRLAGAAYRLGPAPAAESYLKKDRLLEVAKAAGAEAVHPGYGFLSENADFAEAVQAAGLIWIGPPPEAIRAMGLKDAAKAAMEKANVPVVPGYHGSDQDPEHLAKAATEIGFPVLIKAVAGGGGKGMRRVERAGDFADALAGCQREGAASFGDDRVLVEKFVTRPRHIEIQVFADSHGNAVHLFERDCSLQRRHQKVIEEAPAPDMPEDMRAKMGAAAVAAAKAIGYRGAGTIEFIADASDGLQADRFYFMEMNTRLQVEHPVTEAITGQDLVDWQFRVAAGEPLPCSQKELAIHGHAVEARLYAEDPGKGFLPSTGRLTRMRLDDSRVRIDTGVAEGDTVSVHYDPMIAKLIAHGESREAAIARLADVLDRAEVTGPATNAAFLLRVLEHPGFRAAEIDTHFIDTHGGALTDPLTPGADDRVLAVLAVLLKREAEAEDRAAASGDPYTPWQVTDGFRLNASGLELLRFSGETGFTAQVARAQDGIFTILIDDAGVQARGRLDPEGQVEAILGDRQIRAGVAFKSVGFGGTVTVFRAGAGLRFTLFDPLAAAEAEEAGGGNKVTAPMPGKVVRVLAKAGDAVTKGQPLVVLEAMKMEHTLKAPADGTLGDLRAREGDQVDDGAVLAVMAENE